MYGKESILQGTVFRGPEVALPGKRDRNRTSYEINAHDVPHLRDDTTYGIGF